MPENIGQHRQDSSDSGGHEFFDVTNAFFFSERADAVLHTVQAIGNRRYVVNAVKLYNASGGAIACGAGPLLHCNKWQAGEWDDANIGDDYTDKTDEAQNTVADDFALQTLAADDGHVLAVGDRRPRRGALSPTSGSRATCADGRHRPARHQPSREPRGLRRSP